MLSVTTSDKYISSKSFLPTNFPASKGVTHRSQQIVVHKSRLYTLSEATEPKYCTNCLWITAILYNYQRVQWNEVTSVYW